MCYQRFLTMSKTYLTNFFQEKQINYQMFEIADAEGLTHFIDTDYVIEAIHQAPINEQQVITQTLRKLYFYNQPIGDYLEFLATALVKQYETA